MFWFVFFVLVLLLVTGVVISYHLTIGHYVLYSSKLRSSVRLLLIADLHSCRYGEKQETLVRAIEDLSPAPDALMFCGDIADDKIPIENTEALLDALANRYPCYYITGNHEFWSGEVEKIKDVFRRHGVVVLEGNSVPLSIRGEKTVISGVDDPESGNFESQFAEVSKGINAGSYSILLSHRPEKFARYVSARFDLVLSGHAHGGLWRVPGILRGFVAPNQGFFPKYTSGEYKEQSTTMIVSRGLARESTRIPRFFNSVELVVVDLLPEEASRK